MQKNLVIVESPAKAKTIGKFLGNDYKVMSSYGHIRDLKKKEFSIDMKTFTPQYEIPTEKTKLVNELKAEAKKSARPYGLHPMRTARERPFHGTWRKCWA
jgi:DNA topoisomerase-1